MYGGQFCVAGWDPEAERMVRPMSSPWGHWPAEVIGRRKFCTGNLVRVTPTEERSKRSFPHKTEDVVIDPASISRCGVLQGAEFTAAISGSVSSSITKIFDNNLVIENSCYVPANVKCRSLGAVDRALNAVTVYEDGWGKLRCQIRRGSAHAQFKVSSKLLKDIYDADGNEGLEALREGCTRAHVRIGLAGAWSPRDSGQPKRCYAMVNNIIFY